MHLDPSDSGACLVHRRLIPPPGRTIWHAAARAQKMVKNTLHKLKKGTLKSGRSGKRVTKRTQAIAIGLSGSRKGHEGAKAAGCLTARTDGLRPHQD